MDTKSRDLIRHKYSHGGEAYDRIRVLSPRGRLLTQHDIGMFRRLLPKNFESIRVLAVGAGTGRFTLAALDIGYHVTATDINEAQLASLRVMITERELADRCEVQVEDVFALTFGDNKFDVVFCF